MKKSALLLIALFAFVTAIYAQTQKIFLDDQNNVVDSAKANWYKIAAKGEDGLWFYNELTKERIIAVKGFCTDEALTIHHGPYELYNIIRRYKDGEYHSRFPPKDGNYYPAVDSYLAESGDYNNGKKTGIWTGYNEEGGISWTKTYKDGKATGKTQVFSSSGNLISETMLENGIPVPGTFKSFKTPPAKVVTAKVDSEEEKQKKKNDQKMQREAEREFLKYYREPQLPIDFSRKFFKTFVDGNEYVFDVNSAYIDVDIDEKGKVSFPKISGVSDGTVRQAIEQFFVNSPNWVSATSGKEKKPIRSKYRFTITFK